MSRTRLSAQHADMIIEIAYLQKRTQLSQLAEDSDANLRSVVGFDIEYNENALRREPFSDG